jgi:hypothetical protein
MTIEKVREDRLRRVAQRQGLQLIKSRRRDDRALDFGGFMLIEPTANTLVLGGPDNRFPASLSLEEVEEWLTGEVTA